MSISIKEIFKSDLDPNNPNWWAKSKVDKLNFNFNQLENGGMPGPIGVQGPDGITGNLGYDGPDGTKGPNGNQGFIGLDGFSTWEKHNDSSKTNSTLTPTESGHPEFSAVPVIIGVQSGHNMYDNSLDWERTPSVFFGSPTRNNISMGDGFGNRSAFHLTNNGLDVGRTSLPGTSNPLNIKIDLQNLTHNLYNSNGNILATFTESIFTTEIPVRSEDTKIDTLKYTKNIAESKVLTSVNDTGEVVWRNKYEVFGALPVGSIMSIGSVDFNDTNFYKDISTSVDVNSGLLEVSYGRGRENTAFDGWYLCNGQTWDYQGIISYLVPNLNSFRYSIESDGNLQSIHSSDVASNNPVLIGGGNISVDCIFNSVDSTYDVTGSTDSSDILTSFNSGGTTLSQNKQIHLINLGNALLSWKTGAGTQIATTPIVLSDPSDSSLISCSASSQTYDWTGTSSNIWEDQQDDLNGIVLYDSNLSIAPANKWYAKNGLSRFWNGSSFTLFEACATQNNISLRHDTSVLNLNWTMPLNGVTHVINESTFALATTLNINGGTAPVGWYRETDPNNTVWVRRYWNGSSFGQDNILDNFVKYAGEIEVSFGIGSHSCTFSDSAQHIYYSTNVQYPLGSNILERINSSDGIVFVNNAFVDVNDGTSHILKIKNQIKIGAQFPYGSLLDADTTPDTRSDITNSSRLDGVYQCGGIIIDGGQYITEANNANGNVVFGSIHVSQGGLSIKIITAGGIYRNDRTTSTLNISGMSIYEGISGSTPSEHYITFNNAGTYTYIMSADFEGEGGSVTLLVP